MSRNDLVIRQSSKHSTIEDGVLILYFWINGLYPLHQVGPQSGAVHYGGNGDDVQLVVSFVFLPRHKSLIN